MSSSSEAAATAASSSWVLDFILKWMMRFGTFSFGSLLVLGGLLYAKQESLLYLPTVQGIPRHNRENPRGYRSPHDRGLEHFYNVKIPTADNIFIHAWYIIHPAAMDNRNRKLPTLIFFHGNAGNIGLRLPNAWQMMQQLQCNVLLVDYRGYGDSDDSPPNEIGLQRDAQAVFNWIANAGMSSSNAIVNPASESLKDHGVTNFIDTTQLYLFGRSLGGAVAFHLASHVEKHSNLPPLAGVLVENTFLSISAMVDKLFPILTPLKPYVLRMHWDNQKIAKSLVKTPILYLAGALDDLVPHQHMKDLYQTSMLSGNPRAFMYIIPNGTHNESWYQGGQPYWRAIRDFLQSTKDVARPVGGTVPSTSATMGVNIDQQDSAAIPTMSSKYMDMAKEAFSSGNASSAQDDKKKS